jgi:ubiquinone/menaquinone biosynthesis C-methylase UbiE
MVKKGLSKFWDEVGSQMDNNYAYYLCSFMGQYKKREFCKVIKKIKIDRAAVILKTDSFEESFGSDGILQFFLDMSAKTISLDISPKILNFSKQRLKNRDFSAVATNICEMPFKETAVSLIFSSSTYGYLKNIKRGLKEAYRILKPGGILLISLNNRSNILFRILTKIYHSLGFIPFPVSSFYFQKEVKKLLEEVGFTVISQEPIVHISPFLNSFIYFLDRFKKFGAQRLSKAIMKILSWYSNSKLRIKSFTGWYILFKAERPITEIISDYES